MLVRSRTKITAISAFIWPSYHGWVNNRSAAHGIPLTFEANLTGQRRSRLRPPRRRAPTVVLDPSAHTLHVDVSFSGLSSGTTASHIHCCVPSGAPGNLLIATT